MPGSLGEHDLQDRYGNAKTSRRLYMKKKSNQMLNYLNPQMLTSSPPGMFFLSPADVQANRRELPSPESGFLPRSRRSRA